MKDEKIMINQFQEGGESFHGWVYIEVIFYIS